ncbi:DUF5032 domain-containing protein [Parabacteroides sp. PF5-9]|uniref:DUF5032 domain-containing protein n=1 Tax=Parabacteroides sp. PF5-9 TaxID=1742404 RepID=UPI002474BF2A|nr:DUF5032 domain-containing protein [Parabacteroides sp. PF5-9]MDH6358620.1 hypothetical protein [Parabacteroides sp. PF5-9]
MKRYLVLVVSSLFFLTSCGKDDKTEVPPLKKLTKVTCYTNNEVTPSYALSINYENGQIHNITSNTGAKQLFSYPDSRIITVSDLGQDLTIEYNLQGNAIYQKKIKRKNEYVNNEIYTSDEYKYAYKGAYLSHADWITRWPVDTGNGYESRSYIQADTYTWENGNVVRYAQDKKEMAYEYDTQLQPANFPFRVINSFAPVDFETVSPVNLLYNLSNKNLPKRAYWYNVPETSTICAEYTYKFEQIGEYITKMTIEENNYVVNEGGSNTYIFHFEYNWPKQE